MQWGGPVGVRDPALPADTGRRFAETLGLRDPGASWHADRSMPAALAAELSLMTGAVGKLGADIALMALPDDGTLTLAAGGGSSAMPHKRNPVLAELLVTLARRNASDAGLMHQTLVHEQERSGAAWMLEWLTLPRMLVATGRSLAASIALVGTIERMGEG